MVARRQDTERMAKPVAPRGRFETRLHHSSRALLSRTQSKTGPKRARQRLVVEERVAAAERQRRPRTRSRAPARGKHEGLVIAGKV